jgi:hypothetical protein
VFLPFSWNETFSKFRPADVSNLARIRFEVWDRDFIGKDSMGHTEVTVEEIRNKQLLERKSAVSRSSVSEDYTQEPLNFHLKLLPLEGKLNKGSDKVSGFIDVRIKYYKLSGASTSSTPAAVSAAAGGKSKGAAAPPSHDDDDLDFEPEHQGQTGSRRPAPMADGSGAEAAPTPAPESHLDIHVEAASPQLDRSSSTVIGEIERVGPRWEDIVGKSKLSRLPTAAGGATLTRKRPSVAKKTLRSTTILPLTKGVTIGTGMESIAQAAHAKKMAEAGAGEENGVARKGKKMQKKESHLDFFGLF